MTTTDEKLECLDKVISRCSMLEKKLRITYATVLDLDARLKQTETYDADYRRTHKEELDRKRQEFVATSMKAYDQELEDATRKMCGDFYDTFVKINKTDSHIETQKAADEAFENVTK